MLVRRFRLIQSVSLSLNPGVCFELFVMFANADAQISCNPLASQQPPERKGFLETSGVSNAVTNRRANHMHRQVGAARCERVCFVAAGGKKLLKECLRLAESTQPQAQGYQRQQSRRAQEKPARRALQRAKPPKPFPHLLA